MTRIARESASLAKTMSASTPHTYRHRLWLRPALSASAFPPVTLSITRTRWAERTRVPPVALVDHQEPGVRPRAVVRDDRLRLDQPAGGLLHRHEVERPPQ